MSVRILNADCLTALPQLAAEGFRAHAVVTDPPYGLEFMGAEWDTFSDKPRRVPGTGGREAPFAHHAVALTGKRNGNYQAWCEQWAREVYACMLPGAHLAAFGGTRTWHRMAVAIEDAGFEIRDTLMFLHGVGFPKSHNVNKAIGADNCCQCHKSNVSCPSAKERPSHHQDLPRVREGLDTSGSIQSGSEQGLFSGVRECVALGAEKGADNSNSRPGGNGGDHLRDVRQEDLQAEGLGQEKRPDLLQQLVSQQDIRGAVSANRTSRAGRLDGADASLSEPEDDRSDEPGMEGRGDISEAPRELRERPVCEMPAGVSEHGSDGRLRDGASAGDGAMDRAPAQPNGVRASSRPQSAKQPAQQSRPVAVQPEPQVGGAWAHCSRCGKPRIPDGIGSALKPAFEPIILARKPLESNLAANTLKHGCGGLNIDACRVPGGKDVPWGRPSEQRGTEGWGMREPAEDSDGRNAAIGRWPANVLLSYPEDEYALRPDVTAEQRKELFGWLHANA